MRPIIDVVPGIAKHLPLAGGPGRSVQPHYVANWNGQEWKRVTVRKIFGRSEGKSFQVIEGANVSGLDPRIIKFSAIADDPARDSPSTEGQADPQLVVG
jgi:hypothetical protein